MFVNDVFTLINFEFPTSFTANNLTLPELYEAYNDEPSDNVGFEFVNTSSSKLVPIPSVMTDGVDTVNAAGEAIFDCVLVTLKAVVPE